MKCLAVNSLEVPVGISYDIQLRRCKLGGKKKHAHTLEEVAETLTSGRYAIRFPSSSRMRIEFRISFRHLREGLLRMKDDGWVVEQVTSFGRLTR
jgi:hypothetical protein